MELGYERSGGSTVGVYFAGFGAALVEAAGGSSFVGGTGAGAGKPSLVRSRAP